MSKKIDCQKCVHKGFSCCRYGTWVDLEEAKKITELDLFGSFEDIEVDTEYPSGFKIATKIENGACSFLDKDGLCSIHKVNYELKPHYCKEFPLRDGKFFENAKHLCVQL